VTGVQTCALPISLTIVGVIASAWWQWHLLADGRSICAVAGTDSTAYAILVGCLLAEVRSLRLPGAGLLERIRPAAAPVGLVMFLAIVVFVNDAGHTTRLAVTAASLLMIIGLVDEDRGPMARVVASPPLRAVGRVSYGLYLWHVPAILLIGRVVREAGVASEMEYPLAIVAMTVATIVSYRFVEQPFLRMKHRFEPPA
jgi:peptidoglycan/LPS O-acetylase OafA/YrhL